MGVYYEGTNHGAAAWYAGFPPDWPQRRAFLLKSVLSLPSSVLRSIPGCGLRVASYGFHPRLSASLRVEKIPVVRSQKSGVRKNPCHPCPRRLADVIYPPALVDGRPALRRASPRVKAGGAPRRGGGCEAWGRALPRVGAMVVRRWRDRREALRRRPRGGGAGVAPR